MENFITEITKQLNNGHAQQAQYSVSEDGSTLIYGYPDKECALIFTKQDSEWVFQQKLTESDGVAKDWFGGSVSLSSDGNTALVGAHRKSSYTGAAYIFTRSGSTWTQQQKLVASDGAASDWFGWSVSLSSDGNTALIGAPYADPSGTNEGAAYVFTRSGTSWVEEQKLTASDITEHSFFGVTLTLSCDGNTALVGAIYQPVGGEINVGACYVFTRSGSTWVQQQKLTASDNFGHIVCISTDGTSAKIYTQGGREYTFTMVGGIWVETTPHQPKGNNMKLSNLENKVPNDNGFRAYLNNVEVQNIETSTVKPEVGDPFTLVTINTVHMDAIEFLDQDLELAKRATPGTMVYNIDSPDSIPYRLVVTVERAATEEEFFSN